jgi:hypothetical protein
MATVELASITDEVLDFLVSAPTPEQIIAFHASDSAQERLRTLLDINRNGTLTADEKAELDEMNRVNHFFTLIKARAMKVIKDRQTAAHE